MGSVSDREVLDAVHDHAGRALDVMRFVHVHPELAHRELESSARVADALVEAGFEVERGIAGLSTAFRAEMRCGRPGRTVGMVAMYDAVPTVAPDGEAVPMHCCGHGAIAGGTVGAARALARFADHLPGRIVVVGCPADEIHAPQTRERGGGKALTAAAGVWDDVDVALYAHPEPLDTVSLSSLWMRRERVRVNGCRSLRTDRTQAPLDAYRAAAEVVAEADPARILLERVALDGDVEEGTGLVFDASFLLWADTEAELAASIAGLRTRFPVGVWTEGPLVAGTRPDAAVTAAVAEAFAAAGRPFVTDPPPLPFATDFGNIARLVPAALIGVGRDGGWAFHTREGEEQFAGPDGEHAAVGIAEVLALAAVRLLEPGDVRGAGQQR